MKTYSTLAGKIKPIVCTIIFAAGFFLSGCSMDAISGPEESAAPYTNSTSQPQDPHPGNDDCSVSDC